MVSAPLIDERGAWDDLEETAESRDPVMDELGWEPLDSCKEQRAQGSRVHCGWQQSPTTTREKAFLSFTAVFTKAHLLRHYLLKKNFFF